MGISTDMPIERYGLIGDCGTAALVSDEGSIDWLCLPGFDADPVFGRLLDPGGGHCAVRAARLRETHRRYLPGTPALETTFRTETGVATLTDLFASVPAARKEAELWPFRWLIRRVQGVEGRVGLDVEVAPRDPFGSGRWERTLGHANDTSLHMTLTSSLWGRKPRFAASPPARPATGSSAHPTERPGGSPSPPRVRITNYNDAGLPSDTTFYYRVFAANGGGDSPSSDVVSATTTIDGDDPEAEG